MGSHVTADAKSGARIRVEDDTEITDEAVHSWRASGLPQLPRPKAIENLEVALGNVGMSAEAARVIARASARPDDMRRRLGQPAEVRVPGGVMHVVETLVWSAGVVPYPNNPRELGDRVYPLGLDTDPPDDQRLLSDPVADPGRPAELALHLASRRQLEARLRDAETWLAEKQKLLVDAVAAEGVLQPVTLVAITVRHEDETPPVGMLAAADGSSRTTATHMKLGLDVADVVYSLGVDERGFRQVLGSVIRRTAEQPWPDLDPDDQASARVLTMPARVIVGYEGDPARDVGFADAVRALIGLMHINPPLAYGSTTTNNAVADAVLDALRRPLKTRPPWLDETQRRWFAATMTPVERDDAGLPTAPDVRAAQITRMLLHGGKRTAQRVNTGIRAVTSQRNPTPEERVDVCVELILRPWISRHRGDPDLPPTPRRAALQRALRMPEIPREPDDDLLEGFADSPWTLERLRDQALAEVDNEDVEFGHAQVELATKAGYYMVLSEPMALQRERAGQRDSDVKDNRSPGQVLRTMLQTRRGVLQAYSVVVAGRRGYSLCEVGNDGRPTTRDRQPVILTDELVRNTYGGRERKSGAPTSGAAAVSAVWDRIVQLVDQLDTAAEKMAAVKGASGRPIIKEAGWPPHLSGGIRNRLDRLSRTLGRWEDTWEEQRDAGDVEDVE
jgi:hypothetical protein